MKMVFSELLDKPSIHLYNTTRAGAGSVLGFLLRGRTAGLEHLLQQVELDPRLALVLPYRQVVGQVVVTHQTGERVSGNNRQFIFRTEN